MDDVGPHQSQGRYPERSEGIWGVSTPSKPELIAGYPELSSGYPKLTQNSLLAEVSSEYPELSFGYPELTSEHPELSSGCPEDRSRVDAPRAPPRVDTHSSRTQSIFHG